MAVPCVAHCVKCDGDLHIPSLQIAVDLAAEYLGLCRHFCFSLPTVVKSHLFKLMPFSFADQPHLRELLSNHVPYDNPMLFYEDIVMRMGDAEAAVYNDAPQVQWICAMLSD